MNSNIRLFFITIASVIFIAGCGRGNRYSINGQISEPGFDGQTVYLRALDIDEIFDSSVAVNGKFSFNGEVSEPRMAVIDVSNLEKEIGCHSILVLEPGKIFIDLATDSLSGSPLNDQLFGFMYNDVQMKEYAREMETSYHDYVDAQTPEKRSAAAAKYHQAETKAKAQKVNLSRIIYSRNLDNVLGAYALFMMVENDGISFDSLDHLLANAKPAIADYTPLRDARTRIFHLNNTSQGKKYTDLQGINFATGRKTNLSNLIKDGQITVLDFWASWCPPCRKAISESLVPIYNKYKDKGVNIIGIDVDDDIAKHKQAVKDLNITYPQLIDTTSNATSLYAIQSIPLVILIDKDGTILERDLPIEDIEQAITNALKENDNK